MSSQNLQVPAGISTENPLAAPHPAAFPRYPQSWYLACASSALGRGKARAIQLCGRSLVVFRTEDGHVGALSARCPHLGSDLASGQVVGDSIACPYHHFRFNRAGQCPMQGLHARAYPVEERFGAVFIFLGARPSFPLPTFGITDLVSTPPIPWRLDTQWYMVAANAFDARHFSPAHGRRLVGPAVLAPAERFCLGVSYEYAIEGTRLTDRAVRLVSGARVKFGVMVWGGNLILVRAQFAQDESLGFVTVEPDGHRAAKVTVIVSARRSGTVLGALVGDWLRARLKRVAIRNFLQEDSRSLQKLDYIHGGLRPGDETLAACLRWQATLSAADNEQEDHHEDR